MQKYNDAAHHGQVLKLVSASYPQLVGLLTDDKRRKGVHCFTVRKHKSFYHMDAPSCFKKKRFCYDFMSLADVTKAYREEKDCPAWREMLESVFKLASDQELIAISFTDDDNHSLHISVSHTEIASARATHGATYEPLVMSTALMAMKTICNHCKTFLGPAAAKMCSRCKTAAYCSPDCQAADWRAGHKDFCRAICAHRAEEQEKKSLNC